MTSPPFMQLSLPLRGRGASAVPLLQGRNQGSVTKWHTELPGGNIWKGSSSRHVCLRHIHTRGCKELLGHAGTGHAKSSPTAFLTPGLGASNPPAFPKQTWSVGGTVVSTAAFQTDMGPCFAFLFGRAIRQAGVPGNPGWEPLLESNTITSSKCVQSQGAPTDARHFTQKRKC